MNDSTNDSDSDSDSNTKNSDDEGTQYDYDAHAQSLRHELATAVETARNDGMKYDHMAIVMFDYALKTRFLAIRGRAIAECERAVGDEIDVSVQDESIVGQIEVLNDE